jgi:hypothetical protein
MKLTLFRRTQCELCDHAEAALRAEGIDGYQAVALAWHGELAERYGHRIPVLRRDDTGAELDWPFDRHGIRRFLLAPE